MKYVISALLLTTMTGLITMGWAQASDCNWEELDSKLQSREDALVEEISKDSRLLAAIPDLSGHKAFNDYLIALDEIRLCEKSKDMTQTPCVAPKIKTKLLEESANAALMFEIGVYQSTKGECAYSKTGSKLYVESPDGTLNGNSILAQLSGGYWDISSNFEKCDVKRKGKSQKILPSVMLRGANSEVRSDLAPKAASAVIIGEIPAAGLRTLPEYSKSKYGKAIPVGGSPEQAKLNLSMKLLKPDQESNERLRFYWGEDAAFIDLDVRTGRVAGSNVLPDPVCGEKKTQAKL